MRFCPEDEDLWHHNKQLLGFWGRLVQPARSEEKNTQKEQNINMRAKASEAYFTFPLQLQSWVRQTLKPVKADGPGGEFMKMTTRLELNKRTFASES